MKAELKRGLVFYQDSVIEFSMAKSRRKSLQITVLSDGQVQVAIPLRASFKAAGKFVLTKAPWILKQQHYFSLQPPKQRERQFTPGESHYYLGKTYFLQFRDSEKESLFLEDDFIVFRGIHEVKRAKEMLKSWYQSQGEILLTELISKWGNIMSLAVGKLSFRLSSVKSFWGSCSGKGRISFNLELIKAPLPCIEYIVVHELCHLLEHNHSKKFYGLMDFYMPDWREREKRLESFPI